MIRALAMLVLLSCAASAPEELQLELPERSTVYECGGTGKVIGEWCFDGSELELSALVHAPCWPSEHERFCVGPLGVCLPVCLFCCGVDCGPGCNSFQGCMCAPGGDTR